MHPNDNLFSIESNHCCVRLLVSSGLLLDIARMIDFDCFTS